MDERVMEAVSGFAKTMGLSNMKIPDSGIVEFRFEEAGTFLIEIMPDGVIFCLTQELNEYDKSSALKKALSLCHYRQSHRYDVQGALRESSMLLFLIYLESRDVTTQETDAVLRHLINMQEKLK